MLKYNFDYAIDMGKQSHIIIMHIHICLCIFLAQCYPLAIDYST